MMFLKTFMFEIPKCSHRRGMATLQDLRVRLKSVQNIQKITQSMKMVSAAKYAKAERDLKQARPYGEAAQEFYEKAEIGKEEGSKDHHLIIAMTSDRGLCGAVHSNIVKAIRGDLASQLGDVDTKIVAVGDKSRSMLQRMHADKFILSFNELGRQPPVFKDAAIIALAILDSGYQFDTGCLYYNRFKSVVSYLTKNMPLFSLESISKAEKMNIYDSLDEEVLQSYNEFSFASLIYYTLKECATSEQSSRMTAMDAASKNAGEMIDKLTVTMNRTRQAVITRELVEIISGAMAIDEKRK